MLLLGQVVLEVGLLVLLCDMSLCRLSIRSRGRSSCSLPSAAGHPAVGRVQAGDAQRQVSLAALCALPAAVGMCRKASEGPGPGRAFCTVLRPLSPAPASPATVGMTQAAGMLLCSVPT